MEKKPKLRYSVQVSLFLMAFVHCEINNSNKRAVVCVHRPPVLLVDLFRTLGLNQLVCVFISKNH